MFTALLGLATSAGTVVSAAAHAEPIDLGAAMKACAGTYLRADAPDNDAFGACVDRAVSMAVAQGTTDGASVNTAILGSATDGGVNTAIAGSACGDGSVNTAVLGNAGC